MIKRGDRIITPVGSYDSVLKEVDLHYDVDKVKLSRVQFTEAEFMALHDLFVKDIDPIVYYQLFLKRLGLNSDLWQRVSAQSYTRDLAAWLNNYISMPGIEIDDNLICHTKIRWDDRTIIFKQDFVSNKLSKETLRLQEDRLYELVKVL